MKAFYINLTHRTDRRAHITWELIRHGFEAVRVQAQRWQDYTGPYDVTAMRTRTPGSIGNMMSNLDALERVRDLGQPAIIVEDDAKFCSDLGERLKIIQAFTDANAWDIIWLGGTFHINPPFWHRQGPSGMDPDCSAQLGRDAERVPGWPRIVRTYGAFSTYAYLVNPESVERMLGLIRPNIPGAIGLDWLFIKLQPQLRTFAFVPGCAKQIADTSDVSGGIRDFEAFSFLGPYWWQDRMESFDPTTFDWAEAK